MRVWIAIGGWDYEGYSKPIGVFKTERLAREAIRAHEPRYDETDALPYDLNKPGQLIFKPRKRSAYEHRRSR